jgi:hypothetical protein
VKVGLVSNWHERCGIAEYARNLQKELEKEFEVVVFTDPVRVEGVPITIINWHPARTQMPPTTLRLIQTRGIKVIVIFHNSDTGYYEAKGDDPLLYADAVVSHHRMDGNINICYIPHGIPVVDQLRAPGEETYIGIAGFPYAWKRFNVVAEAARRLNGRALLIAPVHDMGDTHSSVRNIQMGYPGAIVLRDWMSTEEVVRTLSGCTLNIFWYQHLPGDDNAGQSGSATFGVAAKRPLIVSRHRKLTHIAAYEDAVYVADTEAQVYEMAAEIVSNLKQGLPVKWPDRILKDMGWDVTGYKYRCLVHNLMMVNSCTHA